MMSQSSNAIVFIVRHQSTESQTPYSVPLPDRPTPRGLVCIMSHNRRRIHQASANQTPSLRFSLFSFFDRVRSTEHLRIIPNGTTDQALGPVSLEPERWSRSATSHRARRRHAVLESNAMCVTRVWGRVRRSLDIICLSILHEARGKAVLLQWPETTSHAERQGLTLFLLNHSACHGPRILGQQVDSNTLASPTRKQDMSKVYDLRCRLGRGGRPGCVGARDVEKRASTRSKTCRLAIGDRRRGEVHVFMPHWPPRTANTQHDVVIGSL